MNSISTRLQFKFLFAPFFLIFSLSLSLSLSAQNTLPEIAKSNPESRLILHPKAQFGTTLAIDGDYAVVGVKNRENPPTGTVAYVLHHNQSSWQIIARLNTDILDYFYTIGVSVDISGNTIVVGSIFDKAYVYVKPDGGWTDMPATAVLTISDYDSFFGKNVSISGNDIVVSANSSGFVFEKPNSGWTDMTETAKLTTADEIQDISDIKINNSTIALKCSGFNGNNAYVYEKPDGGWTNMTETAKLEISDVNIPGLHGSLALSTNLIAVTAPGEYGNDGKAYVFEKSEDEWSDMNAAFTLTPSNASDNFGKSVDISANTIVVGLGGNEDQTGLGYVFEKPDGGWTDMTETATLSPSNAETGDHFGEALSISENVIFVGAPFDDQLGQDSGLVYVYQKTADHWQNSVEIQNFSMPEIIENRGDYYGSTVDSDGEYTVVGATESSSGKGTAYVLKHNGTSWETIAKLTASDGISSDDFGYSVSISENVIIVSAPKKENANNSGCVYLFEKPEDGWSDMTETAKLHPDQDANSGEKFGFDVDNYGDNVIIGAPNNAPNTYGAAYLFKKPSASWADMSPDKRLQASEDINYDGFGYSVAISDKLIAVGNWYHYNNHNTYIFEKDNGTFPLTETAQLSPSDGENYNNYFGASVSAYENTVAVSAQTYNSFQPNSKNATAYIYEKPQTGWVDMTQTAKLVASETYGGFNSNSSIYVSQVDMREDFLVLGFFNITLYGGAYVFKKPVNGWATTDENTKLLGSDVEATDQFGCDVSLSEDHIVVGARAAGAAYLFDISSLGTTKIENENNAITLYPNPTSGIVNISTEKNTDLKSIAVFSISGKQILQQKASSTLDLSQLSSGVYFVKLTDKNGNQVVKRVVKE